MATATSRVRSEEELLPDDGVTPLAAGVSPPTYETSRGAQPPSSATERVADAAQSAAQSVKRGVERVGALIREGDPTTWRTEIESAIRRRPIGTVLVGASIGFLAARALRR
ncbi:MAG TPA: hypothetical protein VFD92_22130 [Candidatus Binatia bacterium]|nr:hypothetical protein [Candidatus Binatia bacterium]